MRKAVLDRRTVFEVYPGSVTGLSQVSLACAQTFLRTTPWSLWSVFAECVDFISFEPELSLYQILDRAGKPE